MARETIQTKEIEKTERLNIRYASVVTSSIIILPAIGCIADHYSKGISITFEVFSKWFIFSAVGLRLFLAGFKQITDPAFTANEIFHIEGSASNPVVRELGFANLCFGLVGIISLFLPAWRIVSGFASGLYYGMAAALHLIKKPAGMNEKFALISDIVIFLILAIYFIMQLP
jgi:hypothetical protein